MSIFELHGEGKGIKEISQEKMLELINKGVRNCVVILRELRQLGYSGGISVIQGHDQVFPQTQNIHLPHHLSLHHPNYPCHLHPKLNPSA